MLQEHIYHNTTTYITQLHVCTMIYIAIIGDGHWKREWGNRLPEANSKCCQSLSRCAYQNLDHRSAAEAENNIASRGKNNEHLTRHSYKV